LEGAKVVVASAFVVGLLAGAGVGLMAMAVLTAGSRADAWSDGYKAGALAEREVERQRRMGIYRGAVEDR
jgi:hypothetical protein